MCIRDRCVWRLNESDQRRVEIVEDPSEADYLIHLYVGDTNERFERQHMFQRLRDITVDDIVLCSIFEREQQRVISSQFVNGGKYGSKAYLSGSIQWIYPVSYTHLDVYKRQTYNTCICHKNKN